MVYSQNVLMNLKEWLHEELVVYRKGGSTSLAESAYGSEVITKVIAKLIEMNNGFNDKDGVEGIFQRTVEGAEIQIDIDGSRGKSRNPAWVFYDIAKLLGFANELDIDVISRMGKYCDERDISCDVTLNYGT